MPAADGSLRSSRGELVLFSELRKLHIRAGEPSSREIANAIGGMSHTTVNNAIRGKKVPSWPVLSKIIQELGGDERLFRGLWTASREEGAVIEQLPTPTSMYRPEVSVFVSYASIDEEATHGRIEKIVASIKAMYESMTGEDVGVFFDKSSLVAGDNWRDAIKLNLSSSSVFLAFLSPSYMRSQECNNEFWEFYRFLESNSKERLIIPLLFGDKERIIKHHSGVDIWVAASKLHMIDASALRTVEPGQTVWLQKTQEIATVVDQVLSSVQKQSSGELGDSSELSEEDDDELAPTLFEQMAQFENATPELQASAENITDLLFKVGHQVKAVGPMMGRATTTKRALTVARQLARSIDPITNEMSEEVSDFLRNLKVWDVTVKTVFDFLRRNPSALATEGVLFTLQTIDKIAEEGIETFGEAEVMRSQIGLGRGLSRDLDKVLKKLQAEALRLADSRAIFAGWRDGVAEFLPEP